MSNIFGQNIKVSIFGESHSCAIGATIDGLKPGFKIDFEKLNALMASRRPSKEISSTKRLEPDSTEVICGIVDNVTTGAPLTVIILNADINSGDYEKNIVRASHSDFVAHKKYNGFNDYRGGGYFSGRLTAPLTFVGGIALQILESHGITISAEICDIGLSNDLNLELEKAHQNNSSVGATIKCKVTGVDKYIGNPFFNSLESEISRMMFSVPAVKGIEFGDGFAFAKSYGDEVLDEYFYDENGDVKTKTNHNGGIVGGIANLMPIEFKVVIKPTASIFKEQNSINLATKENVKYMIKGRHDSCIAIRAVPVIKAATALVILDNYLNFR
ncbi:MAG: chorismate synthase [Clostridia bacterium]